VPLFYRLLLAVAVAAAVVIGYDLFQAEIEKGSGEPRIRFDSASGQFTFRKPEISVRIVYASMFGPGEPVMRVRDVWINRFEEEYSDRLAAQQGRSIPEDEKGPFVARTLARVGKILPKAHRRLDQIDNLADEGQKRKQIDELTGWLESYDIFLVPLDARAGPEEKLLALRKLIAGLEELAADASPAEKVRVLPRLVKVERRWQGRWVLSANRPRFLTGMEVPDIMGGSKMELLALVQDGYAVPLNVPLAGESVSPLDGPDTYGDPKRRWRDAFIPAMLQEGTYDFLGGSDIMGKVFLTPVRCTTFCIFYNEVLFKKAGIDAPPRTWPEFIAICEKLKAAGITPLTADAETYCDNWETWLIFRVLGPDAWERTVAGVPADSPPPERHSSPPWTDPRYKAVYSAIRRLREGDYFDKAFRGYKWPAAQRGFAKGDAAMMICGTWLFQELGGYKDLASEKVFKLNCFTFPRWPGDEQADPREKQAHQLRQQAAWAGVSGLMVCRQGKATRHAIELVKYLSARDHPDMVHQNGLISCMVDADFPPSLASIAEEFRSAPVIYSRTPGIYARRFASQELGPKYRAFFMKTKGEDKFMTVEEFLRDREAKTAEYLKNGGEEGYE